MINRIAYMCFFLTALGLVGFKFVAEWQTQITEARCMQAAKDICETACGSPLDH